MRILIFSTFLLTKWSTTVTKRVQMLTDFNLSVVWTSKVSTINHLARGARMTISEVHFQVSTPSQSSPVSSWRNSKKIRSTQRRSLSLSKFQAVDSLQQRGTNSQALTAKGCLSMIMVRCRAHELIYTSCRESQRNTKIHQRLAQVKRRRWRSQTLTSESSVWMSQRKKKNFLKALWVSQISHDSSHAELSMLSLKTKTIVVKWLWITWWPHLQTRRKHRKHYAIACSKKLTSKTWWWSMLTLAMNTKWP